MEYIALCASLFLKNALISERKFVTLCTGIGLSFLLFCHYKDTHFLQQTEIPMPFLCTNTSYYCQLAKLEFIIQSFLTKKNYLYNKAYIRNNIYARITFLKIINFFMNKKKQYLCVNTNKEEEWTEKFCGCT